MDWTEGTPLAVWTLAHAAGIAIALLTRFDLGSKTQSLLRTTMTLGLVAVAAIALSTNLSASVGWVGSGATLGVMVIAAVWEPLQASPDPLLSRVISAQEAHG